MVHVMYLLKIFLLNKQDLTSYFIFFSSLGPSLANIFIGFYDKKHFSHIVKFQVYFRYVDDTFVIFHHKAEVSEFFVMLSNLHPSLKFNFEKEMDKQLPFLDVCVEKRNHVFETKVYRKPTFTGKYIQWESFCSISQK